MPLSLGVIVPTYNRADLLVSALDSLFMQTVPATEILVVDDGSTDHTPEIVARYPSVTYLRQENRGKAAALNHGLALLQSDVVIVLDDDDVFPPSALERHCEALKQAPHADFSYGRFQRFWGKSPQCAVHAEDELIQAEDSRRLVIRLMENCFLPNPTWAARRTALLRIGGYCEDLSFNEDYDVILRLARQNEGVFVDEVVLFQRKHEAQRGPARERVTIESPTQKWTHYDRVVLQRLDRAWDLLDFRPFRPAIASTEDQAVAWLQRAVILFIHKVYPNAEKAFHEYRRLLGRRTPSDVELKIARRLLGCRYGLDDLLENTPPSKAVAYCLRTGGWPFRLRAAFAAQGRWRLRNALQRRDWVEAWRLARFVLTAFGSLAGLRALLRPPSAQEGDFSCSRS